MGVVGARLLLLLLLLLPPLLLLLLVIVGSFAAPAGGGLPLQKVCREADGNWSWALDCCCCRRCCWLVLAAVDWWSPNRMEATLWSNGYHPCKSLYSQDLGVDIGSTAKQAKK